MNQFADNKVPANRNWTWKNVYQKIDWTHSLKTKSAKFVGVVTDEFYNIQL